MKRSTAIFFVMAAGLLLAGGSLVFATGQSEGPYPRVPGGTQGGSQATIAKSVTAVTGQIAFVDRIRPVITNSSGQYELMVPRYGVYQSGVKEGETVTVNGYKVDGVAWGPFHQSAANSDTTPVLLVSSATVGGKTYDLSSWADHVKVALQYRGTYGPRQGFGRPGYGPMMGYGPRGGRDFGRGSQRWYGPGYGRGMGPGYGYGPGMGFQFQEVPQAPNQD